MLFEVYPDAKLNMRALYTFTISSLLDVSTTWGNCFTTSSFPDVPSLMSPASSTSSNIYSGAVATSATWLSPSPATQLPSSRCEEGTRGEGTRGGERTPRGWQGCATMKSSSYCCTALGSSPQPQPVLVSRVSYSVLHLSIPCCPINSSTFALIPV